MTIVPWAGHLSVVQSITHSLSNSSEGGLKMAEVIEAGERNTWREIAKIRDHCAVEIALETGVQRLRRSLLLKQESGDQSPERNDRKKSSIGRTPSFYTSPSLLQLSGLNVVDPAPVRPSREASRQDLAPTPDSSSGDDPNDRFVKVEPPSPRGRANSAPPQTTPGEEERDVPPSAPTLKSMHMANFYYRDAKGPNKRPSFSQSASGSQEDGLANFF